MPFNGFNFAMPEFSVVTPQCGFPFTVQSLTTGQVSKLRTSLTNQAQSISVINKILWDCIVQKPDIIENIVDFKNCVTLLDRQALLYGVFIATFGGVQDYTVNCTACEKPNNLKLDLNAIFSINMHPSGEAIQKTYKVKKALDPTVVDAEVDEAIEKKYPVMLDQLIPVDLEISRVRAFIKQAVLADEELMYKSLLNADESEDLINETLCISKFEQIGAKDKKASLIITDKNEILSGYQSLPVRDKKQIIKAYDTNFGQYRMDLISKFHCAHCSTPNSYEINILLEFFRSVAQS